MTYFGRCPVNFGPGIITQGLTLKSVETGDLAHILIMSKNKRATTEIYGSGTRIVMLTPILLCVSTRSRYCIWLEGPTTQSHSSHVLPFKGPSCTVNTADTCACPLAPFKTKQNKTNSTTIFFSDSEQIRDY